MYAKCSPERIWHQQKQSRTDRLADGLSDLYMVLCFAGTTKIVHFSRFKVFAVAASIPLLQFLTYKMKHFSNIMQSKINEINGLGYDESKQLQAMQ